MAKVKLGKMMCEKALHKNAQTRSFLYEGIFCMDWKSSCFNDLNN